MKNIFLLALLAVGKSLHAILADDDEDDREFFKDAIEAVAPHVKLTLVEDGDQLMNELKKLSGKLPDVIFLDLNMPCKNGHECLEAIKSNQNLKNIPVIIYSTSSNREQIDRTYKGGADLYITKPESFEDIKLVVSKIFSLDWENSEQPEKNKFVLEISDLK